MFLRLLGLCGLLTLAVADLQAVQPLSAAEAAGIVDRMTAAFEALAGYRADVETGEYRDGRLVETRRFRYAFKKPGQVRIDMETPHPGMRLVYPDAKGRVLIRFGGWMKFAQLRLAPDNVLFATPSGQGIDQSDFGLLIRNIGRSVGRERRGELHVSDAPGRLQLEVTAADHFLPGVVTRYRFVIDTDLWLPVAVEESTPEGRLKRTIRFRRLDTAPAFPEHYFSTDGEDSPHD